LEEMERSVVQENTINDWRAILSSTHNPFSFSVKSFLQVAKRLLKLAFRVLLKSCPEDTLMSMFNSKRSSFLFKVKHSIAASLSIGSKLQLSVPSCSTKQLTDYLATRINMSC
jgi:hypothetical protein